ncbi:MAG: hypothetical protein NC548_33845 [Lachnospiraceae bacterium]|nr:hypothetical protein [Lachnospiraceae bacterium]
MEKAKNIEALLARLKLNKEKVPLDVLKTKYKAGYEKLTGQIKEQAIALIMPIATRRPEWLEDCEIKAEYAKEITEAFNGLYEAGGYAKKIGTALYKHYSIEEALKIAEEINQKYREELLKIFHQKTCLYAAGPCWAEDPEVPLIYNDLVDKFWSEESGEWITREKPPGDAILIFIKGDKPDTKKEDNHE